MLCPIITYSVLPCPTLSCVLQASEVVSGSTVGTDRSTFSVIRVNITVQDENDNAPEFNHYNYQVTIPEDVHDRTPLSTPIIEVTDHDQVRVRRDLTVTMRPPDSSCLMENVANAAKFPIQKPPKYVLILTTQQLPSLFLREMGDTGQEGPGWRDDQNWPHLQDQFPMLYGYGDNFGLSARVQLFRVRASDSWLRETGFESCAAIWNHGHVFLLYIASIHSAVWMSTWL